MPEVWTRLALKEAVVRDLGQRITTQAQRIPGTTEGTLETSGKTTYRTNRIRQSSRALTTRTRDLARGLQEKLLISKIIDIERLQLKTDCDLWKKNYPGRYTFKYVIA